MVFTSYHKNQESSCSLSAYKCGELYTLIRDHEAIKDDTNFFVLQAPQDKIKTIF